MKEVGGRIVKGFWLLLLLVMFALTIVAATAAQPIVTDESVNALRGSTVQSFLVVPSNYSLGLSNVTVDTPSWISFNGRKTLSPSSFTPYRSGFIIPYQIVVPADAPFGYSSMDCILNTNGHVPFSTTIEVNVVPRLVWTLYETPPFLLWVGGAIVLFGIIIAAVLFSGTNPKGRRRR